MRLALVVPAGRSWAWQAALAERLTPFGPVEIFQAKGKGPPALLTSILGVERWVSRRARDLPSLYADPASRPSLSGASGFDLVVNLTGRALDVDAPEVLEVLYDGDPNERSLLGRIVAGGTPLLSVRNKAGEVLAAWLPALPHTNRLGPSLAAVHARLTELVIRAVEQARSGRPAPALTAIDRAAEPYSGTRLLAWSVRHTLRALTGRLSRRPSAEDRWTLAVRRAQPSWPPEGTQDYVVLDLEADPFLADPFLIAQNGRTYLFAEGFRPEDGRGTIVWAELDGGRPRLPFSPALERPYHLSYPFVFRHEGQIYMLPETMQNNQVELYRCDRFPDRWSLAQVLLPDTRLADPTLLHWSGRWWLFGAISVFGEAPQDELVAYMAPSPFGPWVPHPANPLKSDVRSSRPAGRFVERDGRLWRPAQDCEASYGGGLVWCEVDELSPTGYRERCVAHWSGADFGAFDGVHTYDALDGWEVIDLRRSAGRQSPRAASMSSMRGPQAGEG